MKFNIEKAEEIGFCFGVSRAIDILEKAVKEHGTLETLGAIVHNEQVLERLSRMGVKLVKNVRDIQGSRITISSHGVSPETEAEIKQRQIEIIDTTCPFVRRAQIAARRLADSGFFVVIYGEAEHPEVKGILGWARGKGMATLEAQSISRISPLPKHLGILAQTTQVPELFTEFAKDIIDIALTRDSEIRIIDTICHDIRTRQKSALEIAKKVDLMLVIGGRFSANTKRLAELCSGVVETHLIETAKDIDLSWLMGKKNIGITSGASTSEETINEVLARLERVRNGG